jgi:serine-type D-Ala-D-Ala carboxypeptidase (penicillin-binding protein 5/6)
MGEERLAPASMSKLMTVYMLFDALKRGDVKLTDSFHVSEKAWAMQGSKMFVDIDSDVKVEDLLRGILIQSGNDACIVVAEGLAGSEEEFANRMNKKAKEIGLTGSNFTNSTGWPDPNHYMTAKDIEVLSEHIIRDFPEYYPYFAEKEFVWNGIKQGNRNPLLYKNIGVDGLKTGHLSVSGFGLVASAQVGDRRIFMVIHGLGSMQSRSDEATKLITWAFQSFQNVKLANAGDALEEAPVWYGDADTVPLTVAKDLVATLPKGNQEEITAKAVFQGPVQAPVAAGQELGKLVVTSSSGTTEVPLVAAAAVERVGFFGHIFATLKYLVSPQG